MKPFLLSIAAAFFLLPGTHLFAQFDLCDPSVPYAITDPVMIQLIATNPDCCFTGWSPACQDLYDSLSSGGGGGCDATFTNETFDGYFFTFAAQPSALIYAWDFGDGSIPADVASTVTHTFSDAGTYNVCLSVTCADFTSDTACEEITVGLVECASIDDGSSPYEITDNIFQQVVGQSPECCEAEWTADCEEAYQQLYQALPCLEGIISSPQGDGAFEFSAVGQYQGIAEVIDWNFGDGQVSADDQQTIVHQFTDTGSFSVCVSVSCVDGDEEETCTIVDVTEAPCAALVDPAFPYEADDPFVSATIAEQSQCCSDWIASCDQTYNDLANASVNGSFQATIVQQEGLSVPGALVDIYDSFGELIETVISNDQGEVLVENLPAGSYVVSVNGQGISQNELFTFELDYNTPDLSGQSIPVFTDGSSLSSLLSAGIKLYPNPARRNVIIQSPYKSGSLQIIGSDGKMMYESEGSSSKTFQIDVENWPVGIYFVHLVSQEMHFQSKFFVL